MSPAVEAALIGGMAGGVVGGVFGILGVLLGLVGERWMPRILGGVECVIEEGDWYVQRKAESVEARDLSVAFLNRKDVPVTVWKMRIDFSKGGEPIAEWARPKLLSFEGRNWSPVGIVTLPPHLPVPLMLKVEPGRADIIGELEKMDRAVFVATLIGAPDKRKELRPPWNDE